MKHCIVDVDSKVNSMQAGSNSGAEETLPVCMTHACEPFQLEQWTHAAHTTRAVLSIPFQERRPCYKTDAKESVFQNWPACRLFVTGSDWIALRPQTSFGTAPRPPLQPGLSRLVWSTPEFHCCIHTWPKDPHQGGTNLSLFHTNYTRHVWKYP